MWHSVLWSISSQETTLWCEPYFDMWVFRWAGRCVNTHLPGLSMTFNNRIWSLSQHFIQALNLKVEPGDFKKFMIPQTQEIFPHDRYLRTKSVKPALCGLALFAWAPALGCSEVSSKLPWLRVSLSRRLGWGRCPPPPSSLPQDWSPPEAIWLPYRPSPYPPALWASAWVPCDKDSVSTWKSNCWHILLFPWRKSVPTNPLKPRTANAADYGGSRLSFWSPLWSSSVSFSRLQMPAMPTIPSILPTQPGPSPRSGPQKFGQVFILVPCC